MINRLRLFPAPPVFQGEEKNRVVALLNKILFSLAIVFVLGTIPLILNNELRISSLSTVVIQILLLIGLLTLMRAGYGVSLSGRLIRELTQAGQHWYKQDHAAARVGKEIRSRSGRNLPRHPHRRILDPQAAAPCRQRRFPARLS